MPFDDIRYPTPDDEIEARDNTIKILRAENAKLKEALEFIDDHGRALAALEIIKAQKAEIERINAEIKTLTEDRKIGWQIILDMSSAIKVMAAELGWDYETLLKRGEKARVLKE